MKKVLITIMTLALLAITAKAQTSSTDEHIYSVIGTFIGNWDTDIDMSKYDDNTYVATIYNLAVGSYEFKVRQDHNWAYNWGADKSIDGPNFQIDVSEEGSTLTIIFNSTTHETTFTFDNDYEIWSLAGDKDLFGSDWDKNDTKFNMLTINGEKYIKEIVVILQKGTYQFKVYKNNSDQESYPSSNATLEIEDYATYSVNFTFDVNTKEVSAKAKKTDDILCFNYISKGKFAEVTNNPKGYKGVIIIPATVLYEGDEYSVSSIGESAFENCSVLTSLYIPNSVTSIGDYAFYGCSGLSSITIPNSVETIGTGAFGECSGLKTITLPNSVESIGDTAFKGCSDLNSVAMPNNVTTIGVEVFHGCSSLASVTIPNSVTSISDYAFYGCSSLASITIPNSVETIGTGAFCECSGLKTITLPNILTSISNIAFLGCSGLTSFTIPNSVTSIGGSAFDGCIGLTSITIPNSVTSISSYAFQNCSGLNTLTIGNKVNYIGSSAFANCSQLTDVYCLAEKVPNADKDIFDKSYIEYATLHVPSASLNDYNNADPWKKFKNKVYIGSGEIPDTPKCATPTISFKDGKLTFSCATEGVEYISEITAPAMTKKYDNEISLSSIYTVTVYATKTGYINSDKASIEIEANSGIRGDLNSDGRVNVADHVELSKIIMGNNQE